jgi:hypothetical protein
MFNFHNRNSKKTRIVIWIIVGLLCLCMVLPMAYSLVALIVGAAG